jgi:hypothetical protein
MRVFHGRVESANEEAKASALRRLGEALQGLSKRALAREDFERFEREVHALFNAAEREVLAEELARLDVDLPHVDIGGVCHHRVLRSTETYLSAVGPLTVERTLYRAGRAPAVVPLELRAGIVEGQWTALAARQAAYLVAHVTPQEAAGVLAELGNMTPSKSSLDRLPKRLSTRWEAEREGFEARLREALVVPEGAVPAAASLDGVLVPMKDGERAAKREQARVEGKEARGPAGDQEVGCATLSFYDAEGERLGTVRFARMPEAKKKTLKSTLGAEVRAASLPIGSGVVEAACKTLASQRLKRSGMRWRQPGGQAILTLRALIQSERFGHGWAMLSATYKTSVVVPSNVTPFPRKRAA